MKPEDENFYLWEYCKRRRSFFIKRSYWSSDRSIRVYKGFASLINRKEESVK